MNSSEYGNVSWIVFVVAAYGLTALSVLAFTLATRRLFTKSMRALKEEGFSTDKPL